MAYHDDPKAMCPFFTRSTKQQIICEGYYDKTSLTMSFLSKRLRNLHRDKYCDSCYHKCEIAKLLESKYD